MTVYADVLILVNFIVDYFLLRLTSALLRVKTVLWRMILSAFLGGIFSLYIFLPQSPVIIEIVIKLLICCIMTAVAFGFGNTVRYLRASALFFGVSFGFAGLMLGFWYAFKPNGMVINNSVVYFDISPVFLVLAAAVYYFLSMLAGRLLRRRTAAAEHCKLSITVQGRSVILDAVIDTGNSVCDPFGCSQVIIISSSAAEKLLKLKENKHHRRYRAIPCGTVTGVKILDGYRCDSAEITVDGRTFTLKEPIAAVSETRLADCEAIINPETVSV